MVWFPLCYCSYVTSGCLAVTGLNSVRQGNWKGREFSVLCGIEINLILVLSWFILTFSCVAGGFKEIPKRLWPSHLLDPVGHFKSSTSNGHLNTTEGLLCTLLILSPAGARRTFRFDRNGCLMHLLCARCCHIYHPFITSNRPFYRGDMDVMEFSGPCLG